MRLILIQFTKCLVNIYLYTETLACRLITEVIATYRKDE